MQKHLFLFAILMLFCSFIFGQKDLPIIRANSEKAQLFEGSLRPLTWYLSPEAKPDIYYASKSLEEVEIALITDVDSVKIKLKPGEQFDLIVLLNGKDSCHNRFIHRASIKKYSNLRPATHDTILFELTDQHSIKIPVIINGQDSLHLMFDSNTSRLTLKEEAIIKMKSLLTDQKESESYDFRRLPSKNMLQIGNLKWEELGVFSTKLSGHGTDGRFGWDLFDGRIIEIDYENERFIIHSSLSKIPKGYAKFDMTFTRGYFHIKGDLVVEGKKIKSRFLMDTGYNRAILLDPNLMKRHRFPENIEVYKTNELRNGQGEVFVTKIFETGKICFDKFHLKNIPTQILPENLPNPSGMDTHTIGNELMKRFNTILDFQNNLIYLKSNNLKDADYTDAS